MLRLLHLLLVVLTLAAYLPPLVNPATFWPISTLGLIAPVLWFALVLFAFYWLWQRDKTVLLSIITLLLGWDMISGAFALSSGSPVTDAGLQVVSLNGHGFDSRGGQDRLVFFQEAAQYLSSLEADIVLLQEFQIRPKRAKILLEDIHRETAFDHKFYESGGPLVVLSRYPLKDAKVHYFSNRANGYVIVDVQSPQGTIRLFNVHLQTNAISQLADEVTSSGDLREKSTWQKVKTMFGRYGRSNRVRTEQVAEILKAVKASPYPVVLGGDFNDIPTSYLYQQLRSELQDAHLEAGWGLGTTYKGLMPGLRIDYLLPSYGFDVLDFDRIDCPFSDHRAIRAKILLPM